MNRAWSYLIKLLAPSVSLNTGRDLRFSPEDKQAVRDRTSWSSGSVSGRLWHSEDSVLDPIVGAGSFQIKRGFANMLHDFTIFLQGQPCHSRPCEQVLSYSRPGSGFHMQGQFIPGAANSTSQQMCLCLPSLAPRLSLQAFTYVSAPLPEWNRHECEEHVWFAHYSVSIAWHTAGAQ